MKQPLWKWKFLTFLLLILFSCQKDDALKPEEASHSHPENHHIQKVSSQDIPKVMDFLMGKNDGQLTFKVQTSNVEGIQNKSSEPDLIITDLETENILALTDEAGRTNYSFQLTFENAPEYEGEVSIFNLIVKEINTEEGFYAYIQEYRMDETWFASEGKTMDMTTYTGKMIFYTLEGLYVAKVAFTDGIIVEDHSRSPCPPIIDPNPGGGGNSSPGPGGDPSGPSNGSGDGGTGGYNITIIEVPCTCHVTHAEGGCTHPITIVNIGIRSIENNDNDFMNYLRSPCPPVGEDPDECFDEFNDPCLLGCNSEGECIEENDGTIFNIATKPCEKLNVISQNQDFMDNINELNTASNNTSPGTRREKSYIYEDAVTFDNTTFVQSQLDDPNINFDINPGSTISGYIHNHFFMNETGNNGRPKKSLNIFSDDDIITLYKIAKENHIQQQFLGFPYILVYQDNMYHLEITDMNAFITLGDLVFLDPTTGEKTRLLYQEFTKNNIKHENTSTTNMNNLAKLMHNGNVGLELYQSSVSNPNWKKVKVNSNNTVSLEDCN